MIKKYRWWLTLGLILLILRLPSYFEPYWYGDEGIYLTIGVGIRKGLLLYQQIHDNKPPTLYYLAALGKTVGGLRLLLTMLMIPTVYLFYRLSRKVLKKKLAQIATVCFLILSSIPLVEGNIANAEIFMLLPTVGAVYLLVGNRGVWLPGLLLGLALTIKVPVAIEWGYFLIYLWVIKNLKIKKLLLFGLGFALPMAIWGIYFYFRGAGREFLESALWQNFAYISSWRTGSHSGSATAGGLINRGLVLLVYWLLIWQWGQKKRLKKAEILVLGWLGASLFGVLLSERPYPHYLIQIIPPLCLIVGASWERKLGWWIVGAVAGIILGYRFYFYPTISYYANFISWAARIKTTEEYRSYFGQELKAIYKISQIVEEESDPNEKIFIWGDWPEIYALSQRLPASRYTVAYHIVDFNGYAQVIDQLKKYPAKLIIYNPMPGREFPQLVELLNRYYLPIDQVERAIIFKQL